MMENEFVQRYLRLKKMRFSGMAEELRRQQEDPMTVQLSAEERIIRLIDAESDARDTKKFNRLIKSAGLRYPDATVNLKLMQAEGINGELLNFLTGTGWLDEGTNLLITGKTGAGKSYCACALGVSAASHFRTVRHFRASELLRKLEEAEETRTMTRTLNDLAGVDLLIIDDFGLMKLEAERCRNLFELIDARDGRKSIIMVSQLPVSAWYELFKENTYADACLDRLTGGSYRLELTGESLRRCQRGE